MLTNNSLLVNNFKLKLKTTLNDFEHSSSFTFINIQPNEHSLKCYKINLFINVQQRLKIKLENFFCRILNISFKVFEVSQKNNVFENCFSKRYLEQLKKIPTF